LVTWTAPAVLNAKDGLLLKWWVGSQNTVATAGGTFVTSAYAQPTLQGKQNNCPFDCFGQGVCQSGK